MTSPFNFFSRRTVLTTVDEEWCRFQLEAARVRLDGYHKFSSLPDIGPHQSFNRSTREILMQFQESGDASLLFLEDDCEFRDTSHLQAALGQLPADWDVVYLGANLLCWNREDDPRPERYSENLFRVQQAWTTHCVGYSQRVVRQLLDGQPDFSEMMFDQYLSNLLPQLNAFVVAPMVAYQRPHKSLIWDRNDIDDYTSIFEQSEELLK